MMNRHTRISSSVPTHVSTFTITAYMTSGSCRRRITKFPALRRNAAASLSLSISSSPAKLINCAASALWPLLYTFLPREFVRIYISVPIITALIMAFHALYGFSGPHPFSSFVYDVGMRAGVCMCVLWRPISECHWLGYYCRVINASLSRLCLLFIGKVMSFLRWKFRGKGLREGGDFSSFMLRKVHCR